MCFSFAGNEFWGFQTSSVEVPLLPCRVAPPRRWKSHHLYTQTHRWSRVSRKGSLQEWLHCCWETSINLFGTVVPLALWRNYRKSTSTILQYLQNLPWKWCPGTKFKSNNKSTEWMHDIVPQQRDAWVESKISHIFSLAFLELYIKYCWNSWARIWTSRWVWNPLWRRCKGLSLRIVKSDVPGSPTCWHHKYE